MPQTKSLEELFELKRTTAANTSLTAEERKVQLRRIRKWIRDAGGTNRIGAEPDDDSDNLDASPGMTAKATTAAVKAPRRTRLSRNTAPGVLLPLNQFIEALQKNELTEKPKEFVMDKLCYGIVIFAGNTPDQILEKFANRWPDNKAEWYVVLQQTNASYTLGLGPIPQPVNAFGGH